LTELSELARTSLAALIAFWDSTRETLPDGAKVVGDDLSGISREPLLRVHESTVSNRALSRSGLTDALAELESRDLLYSPTQDNGPADRYVNIRSPWSTEWSTWRRLCEYLEGAHGLDLQSWVNHPDFSLFDAPAPGRATPTW
jgi:hypothetical protein